MKANLVTRAMTPNSSLTSTKIMFLLDNHLRRKSFRIAALNSIGFPKYLLTAVMFPRTLRNHLLPLIKGMIRKYFRWCLTRIRLCPNLTHIMIKRPARQALLTRAQNKIVRHPTKLTRKKNKRFKSIRNSQIKIKKKRCETDQVRIFTRSNRF